MLDLSNEIIYIILKKIYINLGLKYILKFRILSKNHNVIVDKILQDSYKKFSLKKLFVLDENIRESTIFYKILNKFLDCNNKNFDIINIISHYNAISDYNNINYSFVLNNLQQKINLKLESIINDEALRLNCENTLKPIDRYYLDYNCAFILSTFIIDKYMSYYKQTFRRVDYLSLDNFEELVLEIKSCEFKTTISNIIKFNNKEFDGYLEIKYNMNEVKIKVEELFERVFDIIFTIFRYSTSKSKYYFKITKISKALKQEKIKSVIELKKLETEGKITASEIKERLHKDNYEYLKKSKIYELNSYILQNKIYK
jgi:hypothetical protein